MALRSKVSKGKKAFASYLRQHQSWPERILGCEMKKAFPDVPIYRQSVAYGYILDFYVVSARKGCQYKGLAIEVDGACHNTRKPQDKRRDAVLWSKGIKTIRVSAKEVKNNLPAVIILIGGEIKKIRTGALP